MIVAYCHCYCHYIMPWDKINPLLYCVIDPVDLEYQQSSMRSHLQAPQGNCNEDLPPFPFKGNKKEAEKP